MIKYTLEYTKEVMNKHAGDNFFHYLSVWMHLKRLANMNHHIDCQWFNDLLSTSFNPRTGYIHRLDTPLYPKASVLEMSHDELTAIASFGNEDIVKTTLRNLNKFRGWYLSHNRNRTYMGLYLGTIASLKLRVEGRLSLSWQLLWKLTARLSDKNSPSSMQLLFVLVENYRMSRFRCSIMTKEANRAIDILNEIGIHNVMSSFWKSEQHEFVTLANRIKWNIPYVT